MYEWLLHFINIKLNFYSTTVTNKKYNWIKISYYDEQWKNRFIYNYIIIISAEIYDFYLCSLITLQKLYMKNFFIMTPILVLFWIIYHIFIVSTVFCLITQILYV